MLPMSTGWASFLSPTETNKLRLSAPLLRRVFSYSKPHRWRLVGMLILICAATALQILTPLLQRDIIDHVIPSADVARLAVLAVGLFLIPIVVGWLTIHQRRLHASIGEGVVYDLRLTLYEHFQRMSLHFYQNTKVGEVMSRLNNDVTGAQTAISNTIVNIISSGIQALALLLVMAVLEWRLALCAVLVLPLMLLVIRRVSARLREIAHRSMRANAQANAMMNETLNINGALLTKLFGQQSTEVGRFASLALAVKKVGIERVVVMTAFIVAIGLISAIGTSLLYGVGGYMAIRHVLTVGTIIAFGSYLTSLYGALSGLSNAPVEFAASMASFERVFEVIDLPQDIEDGHLQLGEVRGELEFVDVGFKYTKDRSRLLGQGNRPAEVARLLGGAAAGGPSVQEGDFSLQGISFRVNPGQVVAIVGPSGGGKTTLSYLVPRLFDPTEGRILLDGHDLRELSLATLIAQVGVVTQDTYLFHDTVRANLLYGRPDASDEALVAAAKAANIHDAISRLADGYSTVVGERGYRLSGGERQRLALARVILKDPRILVLDEATSHLDAESEALIQDALKRLMAGRSSIVIAHRLSTILSADLILVIERGRLVERGTHGELLARNGLYAGLYQTLQQAEAPTQTVVAAS